MQPIANFVMFVGLETWAAIAVAFIIAGVIRSYIRIDKDTVYGRSKRKRKTI